jgi:thioredoxin-like negative regulator of GroEL
VQRESFPEGERSDRGASRRDATSDELPITLSQANFTAEVLDSNGSVLVDYWAAWCGPCRVLGPVIHELDRAA